MLVTRYNLNKKIDHSVELAQRPRRKGHVSVAVHISLVLDSILSRPRPFVEM